MIPALNAISTKYLGKPENETDPHSAKLVIDSNLYLPNDIIVKMERASMRHSIEARSPLLDHRVFELAFRYKPEVKFNKQHGKIILKEAFKDILPVITLHRPKAGFTVPINEFWRSIEGSALLFETLLRPIYEDRLLDTDAVREIALSHQSGRTNIGHAIYALVMYDLWNRRNFAE